MSRTSELETLSLQTVQARDLQRCTIIKSLEEICVMICERKKRTDFHLTEQCACDNLEEEKCKDKKAFSFFKQEGPLPLGIDGS